jgi:hypothetical protein
MHRTRSVLATGVVLGLGCGFSSVADARTGDPLREGVRNGTTTRETQIISNIGGYSTRQSNKSTTGGGAIYGCRSTSASSRPCVRANNLSTGRAFEFRSFGLLAGIITVGNGGDGTKPFTTNATGVATGLNADRVDGLEAAQLRTRWVLVNGDGQIESQSGGFTILDGYTTNDNVYIDAGESLVDNGITATLATQNQGTQTAAQGGSGEVTASRCQIPGVVDCAPANSKNVNAFVVTPRNSDGTLTGPVGTGTPAVPAVETPRKRFYATITG